METAPMAAGDGDERNGILGKLDRVKDEGGKSSGMFCQFVRQNLTVILTMAGIFAGFGLGLIVRESHPSANALVWIGMPGELYMRLLKMTIMPLIVCSVTVGASSLDPKVGGKMGGVILTLIIATNILACCLACGVAMSVKPGAQSRTAPTKELSKSMETPDAVADLLRNLIPDNIVAAAFRQSVTKYVLEDGRRPEDALAIARNTSTGNSSRMSNMSKEGTDGKTAVREYTRVVAHADGINVLGLVTISAVLGVAAGKVKRDVPVFLTFIENVLQLVLIVVRWFFWLTPIGVLSLIAKSVSQVENLVETFSYLGLFIATVIGTIVVHWVIVLPLIYTVIVRKNPIPYFVHMLSPVSIAFAATGSAVAMPEMFNVCETKYKMDKRVTRITAPLSITLNGDGSGIFIIIASCFISDYTGVENSLNNVLTILVLTIASILAVPAVPSASIVIIIIVLTAIQVPVHNVAILFAVDWFLDRIRTGLNATSHMTVIACTDALCKKTLREMDAAAMTEDDLHLDIEIADKDREGIVL